jgi:hypothetical protein
VYFCVADEAGVIDAFGPFACINPDQQILRFRLSKPRDHLAFSPPSFALEGRGTAGLQANQRPPDPALVLAEPAARFDGSGPATVKSRWWRLSGVIAFQVW